MLSLLLPNTPKPVGPEPLITTESTTFKSQWSLSLGSSVDKLLKLRKKNSGVGKTCAG